MTDTKEVRGRVVELELRDVAVAGKPYRYLEGRAVPYGEWADIGFFVEQHAPRSFAHSTKGGTGKNLPLLLFHENRSFPIGHAEKWVHDDGGLDGVWRLNDSAEAQRAARAAEEKDLLGLSVGFVPVRSQWSYVEDWNPELGPDHKDRVVREESRLMEVSLTPTPAFAGAEVACVRTGYSLEARAATVKPKALAVDAWRAELERLRSGAST
jgi:HK97 family phage prohead protease